MTPPPALGADDMDDEKLVERGLELSQEFQSQRLQRESISCEIACRPPPLSSGGECAVAGGTDEDCLLRRHARK